MLQCLTNEVNTTYTENGAKTNKSTGSYCLDLFATVGAIRRASESEIENAKASIKYLLKDSSLGFEPSMGYVGGVKRVEWKIKQVNAMLNSELFYYENEIKKHIQRKF